MIKQRCFREHRRNVSEFNILSVTQPVKPKKKTKPSSTQGSKRGNKNNNKPKTLNSDLVNSLIEKSSGKITQKQVIVQDIQESDYSGENEDQFFLFGKKTIKGFHNSAPPMQQIVEVPDTGSYSQRNTQHKTENKENHQDALNHYNGIDFRKTKLSLSKIQEKKYTDRPLSHRQVHNGSKRSQSKSSRSHNCSQSTVQLVRGRSLKQKGRQKTKVYKQKNKVTKLQNQIKMVWQCMGQIWQTSRMTKKTCDENSFYIEQLMRMSKIQERELLDLKLRYQSKTRGA